MKTNEEDERLGLPSASGAERLFACPGSFRMEARLPRSEDTAESARGTRIHAHLAGQPVDLTPAEKDTAEMCQSLATEAELSWLKQVGADKPEEVLLEQRLYLRSRLKPIFSGQPDRVLIAGENALILDYKTGWGETDTAAGNRQLLALAVLLRAEHGVTSVSVGIVQPSAGMKVELVTYAEGDLGLAEGNLRALLALVSTSSTLNPGQHCAYCRAMANCPAAAKQVTDLATVRLGNGEERKTILDNATLFDLLEKCGPAEKMIGSIKAEAKRRIEAGEVIRGNGSQYVLEPGSARRTVTDAAKAFHALATAHGVTADDFLPCVAVKVSELDGMVRRVTGLKAREATTAVNQTLEAAGVLESKASAPSLAKVKLLEDAA